MAFPSEMFPFHSIGRGGTVSKYNKKAVLTEVFLGITSKYRGILNKRLTKSADCVKILNRVLCALYSDNGIKCAAYAYVIQRKEKGT